MTQSKNNPVKAALLRAMPDGGFTKRSDCWYSNGADAVVVLNLQKSQFGESYYLNLGIWLKALGHNNFPKPNKCHIAMRADSLFREGILRRTLDLEDATVTDDNRQEEVQSLLTKTVVPFLNECRSLTGIKAAFNRGQFSKGLILWEAKELITDANAL